MNKDSKSLSILIPTYNDICMTLVKDLLDQCHDIVGLEFEILVGDDGSNAQATIDANRQIESLPHCRVIWRDKNSGRAAIRNFLAREAQYEWLLFIDSHMSIIDASFVEKYLTNTDSHDILYGGYKMVGDQDSHRGNLRWKYEMSCQEALTAENRAKNPYANFHTSNFCIPREVMFSHPLDERFTNYGYEDVLYGKTLKAAGIHIRHINNPVGFGRFEDNEKFLRKTEEALHTLHQFKTEIGEYSRMLTIIKKLKSYYLLWIPKYLHTLLRPLLKSNLTGNHPSLKAFDLYRMGEYLKIEEEISGENMISGV